MDTRTLTVLLPTEFNDRSEDVRYAAMKICRRLNGKAVLLHVLAETYRDPAWHAANAPLQPIEVHYESLARKKLSEAEHFFQDNGIECASVVRPGNVHEAILEESERLPADFIVMGSKPRGAAAGLLGGTVEHVLARTRCPVIVVPHEWVRCCSVSLAELERQR